MKRIYKNIILISLLVSSLFSKESIEISKNVNKDDSSIIDAVVVMHLDQNIDSVFKRIIDFPNYHKNIDVIDSSVVYYRNNNIVKTKMIVNILYVFELTNYFVHKLDIKNYKLTWELDDSKNNALASSKGGWKLEKLSQNITKVTYNNTIITPSMMPSILSNYIVEKGAKNATLWLMK